MRIVLSLLLLLPFKILKFIAITALKIFVFFALCALILNYIANTANTGVKDVHGFQKGPGTERNHTARC